MRTEREHNFVSSIIYLHNDEEYVSEFLAKLCKVMEQNFEKYEIICVNDGCIDNTVEELKRYQAQNGDGHALSLINLSYYQGMEAAMNAGRDLAVGDFLFEFDQCTMDFEEDLIMKVYRRALEGYDVVAAAPRNYVPLSSRLFYTIYNFGSRLKNKLRQERFRIVSRRAVNRVNQLNAYIPYRKAMYMNCGLKADTIVFDNKKNMNRKHNKEEMGSRSTLAMDTVIIFTNLLERASMFLSILFFVILILMFGYVVTSFFSVQKPVEGWLSLMGLMSLGFFMMFLMLTLIFKYLSVILNMMFKRQQYVIEGVDKL